MRNWEEGRMVAAEVVVVVVVVARLSEYPSLPFHAKFMCIVFSDVAVLPHVEVLASR